MSPPMTATEIPVPASRPSSARRLRVRPVTRMGRRSTYRVSRKVNRRYKGRGTNQTRISASIRSRGSLELSASLSGVTKYIIARTNGI